MDKLTLKRLCGFHGINQVGFVQAGVTGWHEAVLELGLPVWVKPSRPRLQRSSATSTPGTN